MSLVDLHIHHLRNISSARLRFNSKCNLIYGANGSGKTSLLEALYMLASGHSFRTREISPLVSHGELMLTVFARNLDNDSISIQKSISSPTQVKINGRSCQSSSELAHLLPTQIFYQDIFQIIDAGPTVRRGLIDWGLFHVEQSYHDVWKRYRQVLKQRNALLRQKAPISSFIPWDEMLVSCAVELDKMRAAYFKQVTLVFHKYLERLVDIPCTIEYYKGWDRRETGKSLATIISEQFTSDSQQQYTHSGAHQADIIFELSSKKAKQLLSRGQQKMVLIALKLAQASMVSKTCIYLFDDITAELDTTHLSNLIDCLTQIRGQLFLTTTDSVLLKKLSNTIDLSAYSLENGIFSPTIVSRETIE